MDNLSNFVFNANQVVNRAITDYDVASLVKTLHNANLVAGWPDEMNLAKGAVPAPFLPIHCSAELQRRKRATTAASKCFFNAVIAQEKTVIINCDSISTSQGQLYPILGQYTLAEGDEKGARIQDAHDISVVSATVATNQLVSGKFTITDANGRYYRPNSVLVPGSPIEAVVPKLIEGIKLDTVNSADLVSGIVVNLLKNDLATRMYMRDALANLVSAGVDNKLGLPNDIRAVPSPKYINDMANRKKVVPDFKYAPSAPPKKPELMGEVTTEKLWSVLERHRACRNADSAGISLLTNPYMFGDIGPIAASVQFTFDLFNLCGIFKKVAVQRNVSSFFTKAWPLVSENMLVVDDGAVAAYTGQATGYVSDDDHKLAPDTLKISMGFTKPNVGGVSLNVVTWQKGEDVQISILSRLHAGRCVLSYVKSDLWSLPFTVADRENIGARKKEPGLFYRVVPSAHAHANMVWIVPEGVKAQSYSWNDHKIRTIWANQWKTYYPFHRKTFGTYDEFFPNTCRVKITGKSRSDNYLVFDVEEILGGGRGEHPEIGPYDVSDDQEFYPAKQNAKTKINKPAQEGIQAEFVMSDLFPEEKAVVDPDEAPENEVIGDEEDETAYC